MRHTVLKASLFALALGGLTACSSDSDSLDPRFTPSATNFTTFVKDLFGANPATAVPTEINDIDFTFLDNTNPTAFDNQLQ
ncbi:hypothetical protein [Litorivivens sp.]|uniref:hypothetical protein n=1 Tax=Litorivivens sp. TaxID=2020868 RepID=UPI00356A0BEE